MGDKAIDDMMRAIAEARVELVRHGRKPERVKVSPGFYTALRASSTLCDVNPRDSTILPLFGLTVIVDADLEADWEIDA